MAPLEAHQPLLLSLWNLELLVGAARQENAFPSSAIWAREVPQTALLKVQSSVEFYSSGGGFVGDPSTLTGIQHGLGTPISVGNRIDVFGESSAIYGLFIWI
jgi:hypothetical protein